VDADRRVPLALEQVQRPRPQGVVRAARHPFGVLGVPPGVARDHLVRGAPGRPLDLAADAGLPVPAQAFLPHRHAVADGGVAGQDVVQVVALRHDVDLARHEARRHLHHARPVAIGDRVVALEVRRQRHRRIDRLRRDLEPERPRVLDRRRLLRQHGSGGEGQRGGGKEGAAAQHGWVLVRFAPGGVSCPETRVRRASSESRGSPLSSNNIAPATSRSRRRPRRALPARAPSLAPAPRRCRPPPARTGRRQEPARAFSTGKRRPATRSATAPASSAPGPMTNHPPRPAPRPPTPRTHRGLEPSRD
jgi:hypothetical protein